MTEAEWLAEVGRRFALHVFESGKDARAPPPNAHQTLAEYGRDLYGDHFTLALYDLVQAKGW